MQFVVLHHTFPEGHHRQEHWDLMFEDRGTLKTWALPAMLSDGMDLAVIRLPDHRMEYLKYEGPISGNRGQVCRVLTGDFKWLDEKRSQVQLYPKDQSGTWLLEFKYDANGAQLRCWAQEENEPKVFAAPRTTFERKEA